MRWQEYAANQEPATQPVANQCDLIGYLAPEHIAQPFATVGQHRLLGIKGPTTSF